MNLLLCLIGFVHVVLSLSKDETAPTSSFHTRPDLFPPLIQQTFVDLERVIDEYIFLCPFGNENPGPYIYDNVGNLVWSSAADFGPRIAHGLHVCTYRREDHLCFFQGDHRQGFAHGHGVIMNRYYEVVKIVQPPFPADSHEFRLMNGKTALMTSYQPRPFDMTPFGLNDGSPRMGWIMDCVFYEIDVETGHVLFQWRASDHVNPWSSYINPGLNPGTGGGLTLERPWDFFHLNSIDKNADGDYLISSRHTCTVYKISGKDGSIMWSLNGLNGLNGQTPDFEVDGFSFCYQHEARWRVENSTHTVISLFDNAAVAENTTNPESRGLLISINHAASTANLMASFEAPEEGGVSSMSQGNMQLLPNGNWFITYGDHPFFAEYSSTGKALSWSKIALWGSNIYNYRGYKFSWIGEPRSPPVLWTFAPTGRSIKQNNGEDQDDERLGGMTFHVSWNGATEVRSWRFYVSADAQGPWRSIATVPKAGFETSFTIQAVWKYGLAEALDFRGRPLKLSQAVTTTVPPSNVRESCNNVTCKWLHDEDIARLEGLKLKDVAEIRDEIESQAPPKSHDVLADGFPRLGTGSASTWFPSKMLVRRIAAQDELPLQMNGDTAFCSEIESCRKQSVETVLELPHPSNLPSRRVNFLIILLAVSITVGWYRRRRSRRVQINEKSLLS